MLVHIVESGKKKSGRRRAYDAPFTLPKIWISGTSVSKRLLLIPWTKPPIKRFKKILVPANVERHRIRPIKFDGLLQVASDYMKPVRYDARKLQGLLGPPQMTSYDAGIGQTLAWIASAR